MAAGSPKLAKGYPPSISSRDSFSSEEAGTDPIARPRNNTISSSPVPSSLSVEVLVNGVDETASPAHPMKYLGAGRFYRPGSEDQSRWKRIRERASWSKSFPRPFESRSAWPPASTRDLLREAGEWLDVHFPVPDPEIPEAGWQLAPSPMREDFSAYSLHGTSRPVSSSTTREEIDGSEEKIVYNHRETKLRELLEKMRRDYDLGKSTKPSREARVRRYLKEIQAQNEEQTSTTNNTGREPVEMDASVSQRSSERRSTDPNSESSSLDDQFPYESARRSLQLCDSLESGQIYQSLPTIDITRGLDIDFSAATTRALSLSSLSNLSQWELDIDTEAAKTPTEISKSQSNYFIAGSSRRESPPVQPMRPHLENTAVLNSSLPDREPSSGPSRPLPPHAAAGCPGPIPPTIGTPSAGSSQAVSDSISVSTPGSGFVASESRERPKDHLRQLESPPTHASVFADLENLARASRTRLQA